MSPGVKERLHLSSENNLISTGIPSPNKTPNLISPIPIRLQNIDKIHASDQTVSSENTHYYSHAEEESESIYSTVFKISNIIGKKRGSEVDSINTRESIQAEFQKLIDMELAR